MSTFGKTRRKLEKKLRRLLEVSLPLSGKSHHIPSPSFNPILYFQTPGQITLYEKNPSPEVNDTGRVILTSQSHIGEVPIRHGNTFMVLRPQEAGHELMPQLEEICGDKSK